MAQKKPKRNHSDEEYEKIMSLFQEKVLQVLALLFVYIFTLIQVYKDIKYEHIILKILIILPLLYLINEIDCLEKTRRYAENNCKLRRRIRKVEKEIFESLEKRDGTFSRFCFNIFILIIGVFDVK